MKQHQFHIWLNCMAKLVMISLIPLVPLTIIGLYKLHIGCPRILGDCYVAAWRSLWLIQPVAHLIALAVWFGVFVVFVWKTARFLLTIAAASRAS